MEGLRRVTCQSGITSIVFSPDGRFLAASSLDKTARVFAASGEEVTRVVHKGYVSAISFSADSSRLLTASDDGLLRVAAIGPRVLVPQGSNSEVALSPQARYVAAPNQTGGAAVFEVATGRQVSALPDNAGIRRLAFSVDNRYVVTCGADRTARVFEISSGTEVWARTFPDDVVVAAMSPDGRSIVIGSASVLRIFDRKSTRLN